MTTADRRKAARVDTGFPVELTTQRKFVEGEVKDLSRSGIRIRLATLALGMTDPGNAADAARAVTALLAESFSLNLHHKRLGTLLPRSVDLTRVGLPSDESGMLDLCCAFNEPLGDAESAILAIPLPPFTESVEEWCEELPVSCRGELRFAGPDGQETTVAAPTPPGASQTETVCAQRYRAFVSSTRPEAPPALFCHTDLVTGFAVRVRVTQQAALGVNAADGLSLQQATQAFVDLFGSAVDLRLVGTQGDLWSGPVRVSGVELPKGDPREMLVTLAFDRRLRLSELRGLGLDSRAA